MERLVRRLVVVAAVSIGTLADARAEALSAKVLHNLLAGGPEGTTILFQGSPDKLFYSPTLKNSARLSRELGPNFIKQNVQPDTLSEHAYAVSSGKLDRARFPGSAFSS